MFGQRGFEDYLREYAEAHQHPMNRLTHTIGIPVVALSVLTLPLMWTGFWLVPVSLFVVGWTFQFIGHAFEGKPPEFLKDWRFLFVGLRWWMRKTGLARAPVSSQQSK